MQQASRHAGLERSPRAGHNRNAGPQRVAGCRMCVVGQRIQEQVGHLQAIDVFHDRQSRRKHQPPAIDAGSLGLPAQIGASGFAMIQEPQDTARRLPEEISALVR